MTETGPEASQESPVPRCAHCGARLEQGIGWCAQCYTPIGAPAATERRAPADDPGDVEHDVDDPGVGHDHGDDHGDDQDHERGPLAGGALDAQTTAETDQMLVRLGTESTGSGPGWFSSASSAMSSTGVRVAVVACAMLLLSALGFGLLALLGSLV